MKFKHNIFKLRISNIKSFVINNKTKYIKTHSYTHNNIFFKTMYTSKNFCYSFSESKSNV